jgi:hypothetical protein
MTQDLYAPPPEAPPPASPPPGAAPKQASNGLAIAALIIGILSTAAAFIPLFGMIVAIPGGIAAIVLGIFARNRAKEVGGAGLAMTGIITGAAAIVIALVWALVVGAIFTQVDADLRDTIEQLDQIEQPNRIDAPTPPASADDPDTSQYAPEGDDPEMQRLIDECAANDMEACNDLYMQTPFGSDAEEFGATCGARSEPVYGQCP